jgi:hypothetical protein
LDAALAFDFAVPGMGEIEAAESGDRNLAEITFCRPFDSTSSVEKADSIAIRRVTSLTSATPVQRYATASKWNRRAALWDVSSQRKSLNSARVRYWVVMRSSEPDARMRS